MMNKVFVVGGCRSVEQMFVNAGWELTNHEDAEVFCFTGGADVSPFLYGEKNVASHSDSRRDFFESGIYHYGLKKKKAMVGICRGGQFLNVMNGGKMWQDVDNHATGKNHPLFNPAGDMILLQASSTHHQMMRPSTSGTVLAFGGKMTTKFINADGCHSRETHGMDDVEVIHYPRTRTLCFQPHPEYFDIEDECPQFFFHLIKTALYK